jgi:hypothetical protein
MHTKPLLAQELHNVKWTIYQHEGKVEYRQDQHMQELGNEASVDSRKIAHISSQLRWDKNNNNIF